MRAPRLAALCAATLVAGAVLTAAPAQADDLNILAAQNDTVTAPVSATPITVKYQLQLEKNDGGDVAQNGCNATADRPVTITLTSDNTAVAASTSVVFTQCGQPQDVPFTLTSVGTAKVSASTTTVGIDTSAVLTLVATTAVVNPGNTAPVVSVEGITAASYEIGSEPTPTCKVVDAEDGSPTVTPVIDRSLLSHGLGTVTVTCSYTDRGGLSDDAELSYTIVDTGDPTIDYSVEAAQPDGDNGWYRTAPTVTFTCADTGGSGIESCTAPATLGEGASVSTDGTATDWAGNSTTVTAGPFKVDLSNPTITRTLVKAAPDGANDWYVTAPTASYTCEDTVSGVASCAPSHTFVEGADQSHTANVKDRAGRTNSDMVSDIDVDLTDPTVSVVGGPVDGGRYVVGTQPAAPTCTAVDTVSGPDGCVVTGGGSTVGTHTYTLTAKDKAGRTGVTTITYTIAYDVRGFYAPVDMNGVVNVVKAGSSVPLKFEVFAGAGGTQEMTATSVVRSFATKTIACVGLSPITDDLEITTTGGTSLRYDTVGGQFIQNWQTNKAEVGTCKQVTTTLTDGSTIVAYFKLR